VQDAIESAKRTAVLAKGTGAEGEGEGSRREGMILYQKALPQKDRQKQRKFINLCRLKMNASSRLKE